MRIALTALCFLLSLTSFSQSYLSQNRKKVRKGLERYLQNNQYTQSKISGTDTTVILSVTEPKIARVDFTYLFNGDDECVRETVSSDCDSCFSTHLGYILKFRKMEWRKIGEGVYVSPFRNRMLLQVEKEGKMNRAIIHYVEWTRKDYEKMIAVLSL